MIPAAPGGGRFLSSRFVAPAGVIFPAACRAILALAIGAAIPGSGLALDCTPVTQDLFTPAAPGAAMIRPRECSTVQQTPPDFSWPHVGEGAYKLSLTFPDRHIEQRSTVHNWHNWNAALPAGRYRWTVSHNGVSSLPRQFTVAADAMPFVVPDIDNLITEIAAKAHPRGLPDAATLLVMASQRAGARNALRALVDRDLGQALPSAGTQGDGYGYDGYGMRALRALMLTAYDAADAYKDEAKRRVLNLATWDPRGPTALQDAESLYIAWVVTLGYDWLGPRLPRDEKDRVLLILRKRLGDLHGWVAGTRGWPYDAPFIPPPLWHAPRDSHRHTVAAMVAIMSTLLVGDVSTAKAWTRELLPFTLNVLSPWSGEEGGYANGTAYGIWGNGHHVERLVHPALEHMQQG